MVRNNHLYYLNDGTRVLSLTGGRYAWATCFIYVGIRYTKRLKWTEFVPSQVEFDPDGSKPIT